MRKTIKRMLAGCLAVIASFSFAGCYAKSAYEIAVENGFQGSEQAWLEYLQGAPGKDGAGLDIREIYDEACKEGYEGTFLEFLKEYLGDTSLDVTEDNNTEQIAKNVMSVVSVQAFTAGYSGSGVIVELDKENGDALILTNYHVVYNPTESKWRENIYVYPYGSMSYTMETQSDGSYKLTSYGDGISCEYVGGALEYDVAVLRVEDSEKLKTSNVVAADMGVSKERTVGEKVFAIGNPKGLGIAVTEGVLSVYSEYVDVGMEVPSENFANAATTKTYSYRVMRTDAAINGGNSGGGLFGVDGKLIGLVNAKSVTNIKYDENGNPYIDEKSGMGYALPITQVKYVMDNILANFESATSTNKGRVVKARFGVTTTVTKSESGIDSNGKLYVKEEISVYKVGEQNAQGFWVSNGYISHGKFQEGDILKTIQIGTGEKVEIDHLYTVSEYVLNIRLGDTVKVVVERGGVEVELVFEFNDMKYFVVL